MNTTRKIFATTLIGVALALGIAAGKPLPVRGVSISELDLKHASGRLTDAQKQQLIDSYLAGHPTPVGKNVCCCQPGWQVYDNSKFRCSWGKLYSKE